MSNVTEVITVDTAEMAADYGFFCYKSKPKAEGYRQKLSWLEQRFTEGLQIKMIHEDGRSVGFIEYTPGEFAWRPVQATDYLVIHCLWVVGRAKKKGYGTQLLQACLKDAQETGKRGVAALTKKGGHLVGKKILLNQGFEVIDQAPPAFGLLARKLEDAPDPSLPQDWGERQAYYGKGLTVVYANQCPYFHDAVEKALTAAADMGIQQRRAVELQSAQEVQERAPSPYGTFGIVYDGTLLTATPLSTKQLKKRLQEVVGGDV